MSLQIGITCDPPKTFSVSAGCMNSSTEVDLPVCGLQQTVIQKSLSINTPFKEKAALQVTQRRYRQRTADSMCLTVKIPLHKSSFNTRCQVSFLPLPLKMGSEVGWVEACLNVKDKKPC